MFNIFRLILSVLFTGFSLKAAFNSGSSYSNIAQNINHSLIGSPFHSSDFTTVGNYYNHSNNLMVTFPKKIDNFHADFDHDGMPDFWELEHGFDTSNDDSDIDSDLDGLTNFQEYIAGSNPNSNQSGLNILHNFFDSENDYTITLNTELGRTYHFLVSNDLRNGFVLWEAYTGDGNSKTFSFDSSAPLAISTFENTQMNNFFFKIHINLN